MRPLTNLQTLLLLVLNPLLTTADLINNVKVDFDKALEGRVGIQTVVEDVVDKLSLPDPKRKKAKEETKIGAAAVSERDLLGGVGASPNMMGSVAALEKRQYCDPGYGYCDFGRCCPADSLCCSYGYCIPQGKNCCPGGACDADEDCCSTNYCIPSGSQCCKDGSYCPRGNNCYLVPGYSSLKCCTDNQCTAYVDEAGTTTSAPTSTTTYTYTTTSTQYYYWTVTWWYWYYYWTYSIAIDASIVTSSRTTTSSTLSVRTTDAAAAESYFSSLSEDLTLPTPASATELETLAGETSYVGEASTTEDRELPGATITSAGDDDREGNDPPPRSGGGGPPAGDDNVARALYSSLDGFTAAFLTFGVGVGVVAVML